MIYILFLIGFYVVVTLWLIYKKLHIHPPLAEKTSVELPDVMLDGKKMEGITEFLYLSDGLYISFHGKRGDFIRWKAKKGIVFDVKATYLDWHYNFLEQKLLHVNLDGSVIELNFEREK
jgi:hypothetical protein